MIGSLRGRIVEKSLAWVLLEVGGVGYKVFLSPAILSELKMEAETFLYIHDHIREDARDLYGFLTLSDLELFQRLINISGIGPKAAANILSLGADVVREAIMKGDLGRLSSAPGVGKKTAQKIILELKGQLVDEAAMPMGDMEVVEALQSLGYTAHDAREALKGVSEKTKDVSERVREALKYLSRYLVWCCAKYWIDPNGMRGCRLTNMPRICSRGRGERGRRRFENAYAGLLLKRRVDLRLWRSALKNVVGGYRIGLCREGRLGLAIEDRV